MEMASISSGPRTVEEIFKDYSARRTGLVRALTCDVDEFYGLCDPEKENLCLYGHANESWEVALPAEEFPPELPEPALGINFARDGMNRRDWLSLVAVHSDSWLLSVAFYLGARLNRNESGYVLIHLVYARFGSNPIVLNVFAVPLVQKRLFSLINDLPTVFEVVSKRKAVKDKPSADSGSKSRDSTKVRWTKPSVYILLTLVILLKLEYKDQVMDRQKAIQGWKPRVMRRMKMSMGSPVGVVVEITVQMNSGFAATYVRGGFMESALR
ncbi:Alfin, N-terminal [Dillenia turbinata]|uniref:PHD finger protein ALFIN-LIKE n=1 Tax=Dillenia turbinata TaxID=194707 RepID=A0AAN8W577_9MAGN